MDLTSKEQFDALMKLAELKSGIREKRREIEWKVSFGVWAATAGAIAYLRANSLGWPLVVLALLVFMHAWLWVRPNYNSSQRDIEQVYYFMAHAARIVLPESGFNPETTQPIFGVSRKKWEFLTHEPIWFEIAATALLGIAVIVLSHVAATTATTVIPLGSPSKWGL